MNPRSSRVAGPAIVVVVALIVLVWALGFGGGAAELSLGDAGPVARWGLPVATLVVNLAAAGMVGVLVTALFTLRAGEREFDVAMDSASISAAVFTVAAGATGFLTFISVFNPELNAGPQFGTQLGRFLVELEVGRTWLITTVAGAALTVFTFAVRSWASRGIPRVGVGDASVSGDYSDCRPGHDRHSPLVLGQIAAARKVTRNGTFRAHRLLEIPPTRRCRALAHG